MSTVTLNDIALSIVDGPFGSSLKTSDYVEAGVPVLQGKNITGDSFVWKDVRYISHPKASELMRSSVVQGDHLIVKIGSIGYSAIIDDLHGNEFAIIPANLARLRPDRTKVDDRYLHHWLKGSDAKKYFVSVASATAQPALSLSKIKAATLPLPPLDEQRRIAAILDRADELRRKPREALIAHERLAEATFVEMFGDPRGRFCKLPRKKLASLGKVSTGTTPPSSLKGMFGGSVPFVTPGDLDHEMPVRRTLTEAGAKSVRIVRAGSTFVCCIGTIGKMGISRVPSAFNQQINAVEWGGDVEDIYGYHALRFFRRSIAEWGASTTLPIVKKSSFEKIEIPIAPLDRQREFVRRVNRYDAIMVPLNAQATAFDALFASLQHRAFRGEL